MFYKIQYENIADVQLFFEVLKAFGDIVYVNQILYVNTDKEKEFIAKQIKSKVKSIPSLIIPITEENLSQQPDIIVKKFQEQKIKDEKKKFEDEHQQELVNYNKFLDALEKELDKQVEDKKKGEIDNATNQEKSE